jgi:hypothetical protein
METAVAGATALHGAVGTSISRAIAHSRRLTGTPEIMKTTPLLFKEGLGVVNRLAHRPLPPPQLRRGVIFAAVRRSPPLPAAILRQGCG